MSQISDLSLYILLVKFNPKTQGYNLEEIEKKEGGGRHTHYTVMLLIIQMATVGALDVLAHVAAARRGF